MTPTRTVKTQLPFESGYTFNRQLFFENCIFGPNFCHPFGPHLGSKTLLIRWRVVQKCINTCSDEMIQNVAHPGRQKTIPTCQFGPWIPRAPPHRPFSYSLYQTRNPPDAFRFATVSPLMTLGPFKRDSGMFFCDLHCLFLNILATFIAFLANFVTRTTAPGCIFATLHDFC